MLVMLVTLVMIITLVKIITLVMIVSVSNTSVELNRMYVGVTNFN